MYQICQFSDGDICKKTYKSMRYVPHYSDSIHYEPALFIKNYDRVYIPREYSASGQIQPTRQELEGDIQYWKECYTKLSEENSALKAERSTNSMQIQKLASGLVEKTKLADELKASNENARARIRYLEDNVAELEEYADELLEKLGTDEEIVVIKI